MSVSAGAIGVAISFRNLGEIWSGPLALCGFYLRSSFFTPFTCMLRGGAEFTVLFPMVGIKVQSSLVKALTNCSFKISTWSVGSEQLMPSFFSGATPELPHFISLM